MTPSDDAAPKIEVTLPTDREIRTERIVNAPLEKVWRAYSEPELLKQWWGRGNRVVIEKFEFARGGHWRLVEHADGQQHGFEGRIREIVPKQRIVQTFEWDGMPGHVLVDTVTFEDLHDGRTKIVSLSLFHTTEERDGMYHSGMADGMAQSYAALEALLATL